jgi:hypothetical protein
MMRKISAIIILSILLGALGTGMVPLPVPFMPLDTITVDTETDSNAPSFQVCNFLPNNCSLRGAISKSNAILDGIGTIYVPAGTYQLTIAGTNEDSNATGDLDITKPVIILGDGQGSTFIQAGTRPSDGIDRVVNIQNTLGHVELARLTIRWGKAPSGDDGGGILVLNNSDTVIDQVAITGNSAIEGNSQGGGIYTYTHGVLIIRDSTISDNTTTGSGGGFFQSGTEGPDIIERTTISGNSALAGGGICSNSPAIFQNVTISGNTATDVGGGLYLANLADLTMVNVTLIQNSAPAGMPGWAIYNYVTYDIRAYNSIIVSASSSSTCLSILDIDVNNIYSDASCGSGTPVVDPMVGSLQDNGGLTWTHALLVGSPAIDMGDNATCMYTDQRGALRRYDGDKNGSLVCDIGAYEHDTGLTLINLFTPLIINP